MQLVTSLPPVWTNPRIPVILLAAFQHVNSVWEVIHDNILHLMLKNLGVLLFFRGPAR